MGLESLKAKKISTLAKDIEKYILYFGMVYQPNIDPQKHISEIIRLALDLRKDFQR